MPSPTLTMPAVQAILRGGLRQSRQEPSLQMRVEILERAMRLALLTSLTEHDREILARQPGYFASRQCLQADELAMQEAYARANGALP